MLALISVNYKTSPTEIREQVHISENEISLLHKFIQKKILLDGLFIISTCNRTEIYFNCNQKYLTQNNISHKIISCLIKFKKISEGISPYVEKKYDKEVITHLFRLTSGLESMLVGEYQIVEQIKKTYKICIKNNMLSSILDRMIQKSLNASKLIRTKTNIDKGAVSVSYAAVEKINSIYKKKSISIINIGTGNTGHLTLEYLIKKKYRNIQILNRTINNSRKIANKFNVEYQPIEMIYDLMTNCDVMVFCTSSTKKLITEKNVKKALISRKKPLLIIDLSVPTNVPKDVNLINKVTLINIDGLKDEVNKNYVKRKDEVEHANKLIKILVDEFEIWFKNSKIRYIINQFNEDFNQTISKIENIESQNILKKFKNNIINNIKSIDYENEQDTISIINNILLKK